MSLWTSCYNIVTQGSQKLFFQTYTYESLIERIRKLNVSFADSETPITEIGLSTRWLPDSIAVLIACLLTNHTLHLTLSSHPCQKPTLVLPDTHKPRLVTLTEMDQPDITHPWLQLGDTQFSTQQLDQLLTELQQLPKLTPLFADNKQRLGFAPTREINVVEIALLLHTFQKERSIDVLPNAISDVVGVFSVTNQPVPIKPSPTHIPLFCEQSRDGWTTEAVPQQGIYLSGHHIRRYEPTPVRVVLTRSRPRTVNLTSLTEYYQVVNRDYLREAFTQLPLAQLGNRLTQLLLFSKHHPLFLYQISDCDHCLDRVDDSQYSKSWIEIIWTDDESDTKSQQQHREQEIETRIIQDRRASKVVVVANRDQGTFNLEIYYLSILGNYFSVLNRPLPHQIITVCPRREAKTYRIAPRVTLTPDDLKSFQFSLVIGCITYFYLVKTGYSPPPIPNTKVKLTVLKSVSETLRWISTRLHQPILVLECGTLPKVLSPHQLSQYFGDSDTVTAYTYIVVSMVWRYLVKLLTPVVTTVPTIPHLLTHVTVVTTDNLNSIQCENRKLLNHGNHLTILAGPDTCVIVGMVTPEAFGLLQDGVIP